MPRYGFKGTIVTNCTEEQTKTLLAMLARQGVQPATLGRELIGAACRFLEKGGRMEFPLEVRPADYSQVEPKLALVAEGDATVREILAEAKAAAQRPTPLPSPQDPRGSRPAAKSSRARKSLQTPARQ